MDERGQDFDDFAEQDEQWNPDHVSPSPPVVSEARWNELMTLGYEPFETVPF